MTCEQSDSRGDTFVEAASCMGKRRAYELAGQRTVKSHFSNNRDVTVNFSCAKWCLTSVIVIAEQTQDLVPFDAQGFFPLLAHIYWGMGRPSGTIETKFTEEDTNRIVSSVDSAKVGDVILTRGLEDIAALFGKAASEGVTVSRVELEENAYILKPLLEASPIHTIHVDSCLCFIFCMF